LVGPIGHNRWRPVGLTHGRNIPTQQNPAILKPTPANSFRPAGRRSRGPKTKNPGLESRGP
jgi:hypothetical protein